ncbi:hypothetical protein [uncultured Pseudoalteromonas sp.]|uniref:hypothetical protein n=1 Tax=uncultured Pseudoalteromonas sp. TaxID=114053 RepID=UPI0025924055|nr:hypothetical protein [uncultured Pseudoalteromonas sp.]
MLEARVKFFDIKKCGYYLRGHENAEFSSTHDTLQKLNDWANDGKELINTTTYEADPDNDLLNTYFSGWHHNSISRDSLLILWNEVANDNGVIYGMNPMELPGSTSMLTTGFGNRPAIPGFPSYFWFIPERGVFATIKFTHSVQGKSNLDHFLNGFMANKSPYKVLDAEQKVIGYSLTGSAAENSPRIYSKFHALGRKQEELEAELLTNLHRIRRIVKRESLSYTVGDDRSLIERVFSDLLDNTPTFNQSRVIMHELQFEPTENQLRQIINNFAQLDVTSSIRNAGFIYNDGRRVMLKGTSVAFSANIHVNRENNEIIEPIEMLRALSNQRSDLLRALDQVPFEIDEGAE